MLTQATHLLLRLTLRRWFACDEVGPLRAKLARMQGLLDPMPRGTRITALGGGLSWIGDPESPGPKIVYCHGGGFIVGGLVSHGPFCARLAQASGGAVLFVDYRLAPEHPFPAAFEDAWAGWRHVADRAGPLWLAGDSAGGGLALAIAQRAVAEGGRVPERLLLISPWTDLTLSGASLRENAASDSMLSRGILERMRGDYLQGADAADPRVSPLFGAMAGLPPVRLVYSESEMLRDDGRRLATRLRDAGVAVEARAVAGQPHIFPAFKLLPEAAGAVRFLVE